MTQTSSSSAQSTWPALSGSVYVQGVILCGVSNVGLASYHFDGPSSAYISYENRRARQWRLDNNTYFPAQKQFTNTSYDPATRTFRGMLLFFLPFFLVVFSRALRLLDCQTQGRLIGDQEKLVKLPFGATKSSSAAIFELFAMVRWKCTPRKMSTCARADGCSTLSPRTAYTTESYPYPSSHDCRQLLEGQICPLVEKLFCCQQSTLTDTCRIALRI